MGNPVLRRLRLPVFLVALCTLFSNPLLRAQQSPSPEFPSEGRGDWNVGVAVFEAGDLPDEYIYLIRSIPGSILNLLETLDTHYLDDEEISSKREKLLAAAVEEVEREIAQAREESAELIFARENGPEGREGTRDALELRIDRLEEKLAELEHFDPETLSVASRRPLTLYRPAGGGGLIEDKSFSPADTARENDLDMYIHGRIEEIEGVIFFETRVWNSALERDERVIQKAATPESLNVEIDESLRGIKEAVYGRVWSELIVEPVPEYGEVYLDGEFLGTGAVAARTLEPGSHTLEVRAGGYEDEKRTLFLTPSERRRISVELEPRGEEELLIRTRPEGADAYLDAVWIGTTPLSLPRPPGVSELLLRKESFVPRILKIDEGFADEVTVGLSPVSLDRETYIEKKRDTFYRTAGLFVLSFPLPFFLYTMSIDFAAGYATAAVAGNPGEAERMSRLSNGFYHGFWGGVIISASLLAHTIYTLIDYILSADSSR